jgi:hypothetical protein
MLDDPDTIYEPFELRFSTGTLHVLANPGELNALIEAMVNAPADMANMATRLLCVIDPQAVQ